jgi:23S rRNA (uracil1939-C5)-methyltransferase
MSYRDQLAAKEALIAALFQQEVHPILPMSTPWYYRNKMEFSFSQSKKGERFLGLMKKRGKVEDLKECHLTHNWFMETLRILRSWWESTGIEAYHPFRNQGILRTVTLREGVRTGEKLIMLTVAEPALTKEEQASLVNALPGIETIILRRQIIQKKVPTFFEEKILKGSGYIHECLFSAKRRQFFFRIRGPSFFQPNTLQAEAIYKKALECAQLKGHERVLDLYCGIGSIGIFASDQAAQVVGIEIVPEAIDDLRANLALNQVTNMEVILGDVGEKLASLSFLPDVVFVDPPRAGLGCKTIAHLLALQPKKIVYISCNPSTQAADCQKLSAVYKIASLQPIDQFPHTPHIENIALLERMKA